MAEQNIISLQSSLKKSPGCCSDEQIIQVFLYTYVRTQYTRRNYSSAIEHFRQFVNYKPLNNVSWQDIEFYKLALEQGVFSKSRKPLSPATVASLIAPIRSFYNWGNDPNIGFFSRNPATSVQLAPVPVTSKHHYLTKREVTKLLAQLKKQGLRDYLIGLSLVLLGLRVSELVNMEWRHFHTDPLETSVWLNVVKGKGNKSREVKVPQSLWLLFEKLKQEEKADPQAKLFPITVRQVERLIQKVREQKGIEKKVTPHWLRHTNATLALLNGASLQQVQETLGHTQITTTQRYLHTVEQLKKAAPDYVEDYLKDIL